MPYRKRTKYLCSLFFRCEKCCFFSTLKKNKTQNPPKKLTTPGTVFVTGWETTTDKYVLLLSVMNIKVSVVLNLNPQLDCSDIVPVRYSSLSFSFPVSTQRSNNGKKSLQNILCNYDIPVMLPVVIFYF